MQISREAAPDFTALFDYYLVVGRPAAFQALKPPAIERTFL
jgi:hypothetical protein